MAENISDDFDSLSVPVMFVNLFNVRLEFVSYCGKISHPYKHDSLYPCFPAPNVATRIQTDGNKINTQLHTSSIRYIPLLLA